jgi:hypothetical protein
VWDSPATSSTSCSLETPVAPPRKPKTREAFTTRRSWACTSHLIWIRKTKNRSFRLFMIPWLAGRKRRLRTEKKLPLYWPTTWNKIPKIMCLKTNKVSKEVRFRMTRTMHWRLKQTRRAKSISKIVREKIGVMLRIRKILKILSPKMLTSLIQRKTGDRETRKTLTSELPLCTSWVIWYKA